MAHILSCPSFSTCMSPHPLPPLSVSVLSSLETTFKLDLFPELELEDKDGDDGNQKRFAYTVFGPNGPML